MIYDERLIKEYEGFIDSPAVQEAFRYLVEYAKSLQGLECFPKRQGYMRGFRYLKGSAWVYGFAVNKNSLVFYFRKPSFSSGLLPEAELRRAFPDNEVRPDGEIKVKLWNVSEARKLMKLVFGRD